MNIKKNDKVTILTGKDKGKSGKILQVFPDRNRASVEGVNLLIKHLRPQKRGEKGQRIEFPSPMNISNLMLVCPKCGKPTRVRHQITEASGTGKKRKARICKRCEQNID